MAEPTESAPLESFSKFTGLPVKELSKPKDALSSFSEFVGEPLAPKAKESPYELSGLDLQARSIDLTNVYTDPIANYASYKVPLSPYADWNEIRAENQGIGQKLGYGALKMGATIVGAVAENTIGIIGGIGSMLAGGTYANNPVGRSVDSANEWMSENLPHYYTKAELDPDRSMLDNLGSANFWTDKFANGLGYSLGSLATAWMSGGAGLLGRGVNLAGKAMAAAGRAGQVGKLVSTGEAMKNIYAASKMIATGTKLTADIAKYGNIARTLNAAKTLEVGAMMSLAESSVEAREKSKQFIQERESEWLENNPGMSLEDMPASDRERINEEARAVENFTFGWNMPVLMTSNLLMFGNAARGVKIGERATAETVLDQAGKRIVSLPTTGVGRFLNRAQKYTAPIYENSLTEAFQEGAQFMIGETAIDYYKNKFDSGVEDMTGAAVRGLSKTFGTADGIESMLLGALIGGGMGATSTSFGTAAKQRAMVKANTEKLLAITNSETFLNMRKSFEQKKELAQFSAALKAATDLGNYKLANELRKNFMAQHAIMFDNLDAIDLAYEKLDDMAKMPEADFMDLNGYDKSKPLLEQSGGKTQSGIVEEWKGEMKKYSDMGKRLDNIIQFMSPNQSGLAKLTMNKEQKIQKAAQDLYNQRLKNILLTNMISMETRDEEINDAYEKLVSLSPALKNFDRNKLVTLIKRNQITADAQGNLVLPKSLVDVSVSDVEEQEKKEGEPKPDPTTEEAAKKKNIKENESLTGALRTAVEESETLDKLQKMDFDKALADFITGIYTRELASTAFDELIKSPEKREIVLAAKQAAEQRAKVAKSNKEADSIVDNADSTRELDELIDHENLSPEMKAKVRKKYKELKAIEDKYMKDYQDIPLEVLEELVADIESIEEESPAKAAALLAVLEAKKNESLEQKDIKEGELTPAEAAAKKEAEDALKKGFSEEADEKADPDLSGKVYENSFALLSTDGRTIRVNGTVYQNLNENPVDAIRYGYEWDMQSETPAADDNTKTPIEGLNERLDGYGNAKVVLPSDFYEGARPKGRLNAFKASMGKVADNLIVLADLNLNEFDFLSEEDKKRLDALRPLAGELSKINTTDISSADRRTVAVEKRYAALTNQLANEFVDIIGKHVEQQLGKKITSSKPKTSSTSTTTKADIILPIGTSGSGKSTFIKSLPQENLVVISPDDMRAEFTGDINDKSKDKEIYIEAAKRAVEAVKNGKQVVFDTTNLTKEKRRPFIEAVKKAIPGANIQYKLMPLNAELAKQRIKADIAAGVNRANVSDETIDRHAASYPQMLEDIKTEGITEYKPASALTGSIIVSQVVLHNEQNQTVEFKDTVAKELAEIILMAYQSQGTIESLGLSEVELRKQIQSRLNALQNLSEALRSKAKYDPNVITDKALQKLMDSHRTHLLDILSVYNMAKEKFMRQGKTMAEMNQDPDVQRARAMYSTTLKAFQAITKDYFKRTQLSPVSEPTEDQGGQMSEEAENEIKNKIGEAELLIDLANETIIGLEQQIAALDASIKLGMASPVNGEKIEKLTKDLEVARAEREIQQSHKNKLTEEYEYRKSSQASKDVQDSQRASQLAQEQGSGTTNQGAVQVPEGETVDVNEVAPLLPEIIDNPVFIETGETQDIFNSKSFETEEEETPDDSDPEEDEGNIQFRKKTVHEEVKNSENQSSIAVIKTQHEYANGYDNILVDEDGTPIPNSSYYGTNGKDGRQQFELKNGKWVPIQIFPELLTDSDIVENGAEVRFEVNPETEWWQKFVKNNPNVSESEYWKNIPIFVAVRTKDGFKRVGLLEGYNPSNPSRSMDRETIYNLWDNGKIPTTILTNKYVDSQNIANAATEDGNVFFFDPVPVDEDGNILYTPTLLVARTYKKEPKWEVTNRGDVLKEDETIPGDLLSRLSTADLGKVAILVRTPNGDLSYIRATTKKMTEVGYNAVVEAITDDRAGDVAEIVGFNEVAEAAIDDANRNLIFEQVYGEKSDPEAPRGYTFWLPSAETYITISSDQLALALTEPDSFVKFQFVEAVRGEEGGLNFEPIEGRSDWTAHMGSIASAFKEAIMKRRYQVDINLLTENPEYESKVTGLVYASYLDYLTHPDEISDMEKDQGHSGILSSDVYLNPKTFSPYFDVVMNFGEITDEKGFKAQAAENEKPTTSRTVTKAKITKQEPLVKEQEDYTNESDMDEEDNQVDSTNALLDDDEIGEVAKRIEEEEEEEQEDTDSNSSSLEKAINRRRTKTVETEEDDEKVVVGKKIKSQGLSGTIAEVEEEKGDPMVEILTDIKKNQHREEMKKDPVTGEETHYIINGEEYERASKMTSEPFTGSAETQKASSSAGKLVHSLVENLLMGKPATKPAGVSSVAYLDLITQAKAIQSMLRGRGETVIAVEMVVYNTDPNYPNIAGTFDILTKDRKGEYRIYDIKTLTASGLENYEETKYGRSKRDQHGAQLSVYAYMFNGHAKQNNVSTMVRKGSTLLIPLRYDDDGTILKVSNFVEKKFTLNLNFGDVLDKKVSFAYKEAKKSSDPAIANHSKKKSPVKNITKKVREVEEDEDEDEDTSTEDGGEITKDNIAKSIISAKASNGPSGDGAAQLKAQIIQMGAMDNASFVFFVKQMLDIDINEKEAKKIQEEVVNKLCNKKKK